MTHESKSHSGGLDPLSCLRSECQCPSPSALGAEGLPSPRGRLLCPGPRLAPTLQRDVFVQSEHQLFPCSALFKISIISPFLRTALLRYSSHAATAQRQPAHQAEPGPGLPPLSLILLDTVCYPCCPRVSVGCQPLQSPALSTAHGRFPCFMCPKYPFP